MVREKYKAVAVLKTAAAFFCGKRAGAERQEIRPAGIIVINRQRRE
jgi:homoserine trans-succinylase